MSLAIRKGDLVIVTQGSARGKRGKVLRLDVDHSRAFVQGVRMVKRYVRKTRKNPQGGQVDQEAPIALSNLLLFCSSCGRGVRFHAKRLADGSKVRFCARCQATLGA